ncbi:MAG: winged helix-turn-helix domain-containing protein [Proteobacteria bacterium]|nr:winged helix-turn-helix domain-containing protein [Pseudomonadota bacterium]
MSPPLRFGHIEIRPAERTVLVDHLPVPVGGRAFDVLLLLVEHRDRLVTKDELLDQVWAGLVVEENNLQTQVSTLRKVLGREAIVTIAGRGYRFALSQDPDPADATSPRDAGARSPASPLARAGAAAPPLPPLHARLIGRDDDLAALSTATAQHRLVTLLGAGGIGKTSLALAVAHRSPRPVAWVELAPVAEAGGVVPAVAQALRLPAGQGDDALPALVQALQDRDLLIVLDNAEHLVDAVADLAHAVLAAAPGVRLLVTSQAALHADGERVFRLDALALPPPGADVDQALAYGAIALFVDQAQAAHRHFRLTAANVATVIQLCRALDGLALAIKLAAARLPLLGLEGVAARLGERLRLLGGGARDAPSRQQTLRAAFDWSHGLLAPSEQAVFRRLGVFVGGCSLELAQAVAGDAAIDEWSVLDTLGALVERSMVMADADSAGAAAARRYRLPEIAREYAALKLAETGELAALQARHAAAAARLGEAGRAAYWRTPDIAWLAAYGPDIDNLRSAIDWASGHDPALAVELAASSSFVFLLLGLASEGRHRWTQLRPALDAAVIAPAVAARFWLEGCRYHWGVSRPLMIDCAGRAAAAYRELGDAEGRYLALRLVAACVEMDAAAHAALLDEMAALERPAWPARLRTQRLQAQVSVLRSQGRLAEVHDVLEAQLALAEPAGLDTAAASATSGLAEIALARGQLDDAVQRCRTLLEQPQRLSGNYALPVLATLATALLQREVCDADTIAEARGAVEAFVSLSKSRGWEWFGLYADLLALLAAREERDVDAARLLGHADAQSTRLGSRDGPALRSSALVRAALAGRLDAAVLARHVAEGARFGEEAASAAALAFDAAV